MDMAEKLLIANACGNEKIPVGMVLLGRKIITMNGCLLACFETDMGSLNKKYYLQDSVIFIAYYVL
jgi:hypothetical protein